LIDDEILAMTPIGPAHAATGTRASMVLMRGTGDRAIVSTQNPIRLNELTTMRRPGISSYFAGVLLGASLVATVPSLAQTGRSGVCKVQGTGRGFPWVLEISA
jgi:hypothetical protein